MAAGTCTPTLTAPVFATLEKTSLTVAFALAGAPADPSTVTFEVQDNTGTNTAYVFSVDDEVSRTSAGIYVLDLPQFASTATGDWWWKASGQGAVEASFQELSFVVRATRFSAP